MKRPDGANAHAGQVSFPGGRVEPTDRDLISTALRETHEELGIRPELVEVVGTLDDINTAVTDYNVTPVVGVLREDPVITPSPYEVADYFWVPFEQLARRDMWRGMDMTRLGRTYYVWFFDHAPHTIWGATAAMTRQLIDVVEEHG